MEGTRRCLASSSPERLAALLDKIGGFRSAPITVEEVAGAVAATVEQGSAARFRSPVGEPAETVLAARKAAPEDAPFLAAPLDW